MKTVGNDLVRHQLHENRKWYLGLGALLVLFGIVLLASLPLPPYPSYSCLRPDDDRWSGSSDRRD